MKWKWDWSMCSAEEMMGKQDSKPGRRPPPADAHTAAFSNGIRLNGGQWLCVGLFAALLVAVAPVLWKHAEELALEPDYRMPHELSNDYWLYERYAGLAASRYDILMIGDSV